MAGESKTTTDHKTIQQWVEVRGGTPSTVKSTEKGGEAGVLRIDFPGYSGAGSLQHISWDEFFEKFDEKHLAFLYQDKTSSGEESRFCKFVSSSTAEHKEDEKSSRGDEKASKAESKPHKAEHKDESKASKTEHKSDDKAHKAEHKSDHKAFKAEHKDESKASKAEHKERKATKK